MKETRLDWGKLANSVVWESVHSKSSDFTEVILKFQNRNHKNKRQTQN